MYCLQVIGGLCKQLWWPAQHPKKVDAVFDEDSDTLEECDPQEDLESEEMEPQEEFKVTIARLNSVVRENPEEEDESDSFVLLG